MRWSWQQHRPGAFHHRRRLQPRRYRQHEHHHRHQEQQQQQQQHRKLFRQRTVWLIVGVAALWLIHDDGSSRIRMGWIRRPVTNTNLATGRNTQMPNQTELLFLDRGGMVHSWDASTATATPSNTSLAMMTRETMMTSHGGLKTDALHNSPWEDYLIRNPPVWMSWTSDMHDNNNNVRRDDDDDDDDNDNSSNSSKRSLSPLHLLPPMVLFQRYVQQHSVHVLRAELRHEQQQQGQKFLCHRRFVVANFECPYQAGMMTLPFWNSMVVALATNRTLLMHYTGHHGNEIANCQQVLQFADWIPTYQEFMPYWVAEYEHDYNNNSRTSCVTESNSEGTTLMIDMDDGQPSVHGNPSSSPAFSSASQPNFNETDWIPYPLKRSQLVPCRLLQTAYQQYGMNVLFHPETVKTVWNDASPQGNARVWQIQRTFEMGNSLKFWLDLRHECTSLLYTRALLLTTESASSLSSSLSSSSSSSFTTNISSTIHWNDSFPIDVQHDAYATKRTDNIMNNKLVITPFHQQPRIHQMYQQGVGFLYGMLFYGTFSVTPTLAASLDIRDWVSSPSHQFYSIAVHSRHPDYPISNPTANHHINKHNSNGNDEYSNKQNIDIQKEQACLDYFLFQNQQGSKKPCRVYIMSDRNATLQAMAWYVQQRFGCQVVSAHNAIKANSSRALTDHGITAGMGYFQDLMVVGAQARSAFISPFRSSSLLPYATMEYMRRMEYYQECFDKPQKANSSRSWDDCLTISPPMMELCTLDAQRTIVTM